VRAGAGKTSARQPARRAVRSVSRPCRRRPCRLTLGRLRPRRLWHGLLTPRRLSPCPVRRARARAGAVTAGSPRRASVVWAGPRRRPFHVEHGLSDPSPRAQGRPCGRFRPARPPAEGRATVKPASTGRRFPGSRHHLSTSRRVERKVPLGQGLRHRRRRLTRCGCLRLRQHHSTGPGRSGGTEATRT
jgi:hypothetical protein